MPVNIAGKDTGEDGKPVPGAPHVVTVRTPGGTPGVVPGVAGPHEGRAARVFVRPGAAGTAWDLLTSNSDMRTCHLVAPVATNAIYCQDGSIVS